MSPLYRITVEKSCTIVSMSEYVLQMHDDYATRPASMKEVTKLYHKDMYFNLGERFFLFWRAVWAIMLFTYVFAHSLLPEPMDMQVFYQSVTAVIVSQVLVWGMRFLSWKFSPPFTALHVENALKSLGVPFVPESIHRQIIKDDETRNSFFHDYGNSRPDDEMVRQYIGNIKTPMLEAPKDVAPQYLGLDTK